MTTAGIVDNDDIDDTVDPADDLPAGTLPQSIAWRLAQLSPEDYELAMAGIDPETRATLQWDWSIVGRPDQQFDLDEMPWVTALLAGRGSGKNRSLTELALELDRRWEQLGWDPGQTLRIAFVARTAAEARDIGIIGRSGILNVGTPAERAAMTWSKVERTVTLPNGARFTTYSSDEPGALRGPEHHVVLLDELASHRLPSSIDELSAFDNAQAGARLGSHPFIVVATTPRRVRSVKKLVADSKEQPHRVQIRSATTFDNPALPSSFVESLTSMFGVDTAMARQELRGELLGEVAGAVFQPEWIDACRLDSLPELDPGWSWRALLGVDPSTSDKRRDEAGLVLVMIASAPGLAPHQRVAVAADHSMNGTVTQWSERAVRVATRFGATMVVEETGPGRALLNTQLQATSDRLGVPLPRVAFVQSRQSKYSRALPVGALAERGRVWWLPGCELVEDEATTWTESDRSFSPGRLDAMVHAVRSAMVPGSMPVGRSLPGLPTSRGTVLSANHLSRRRQLSAARQSQLSRIAVSARHQNPKGY